jgi:hypothetical protein
VCYSKDRCQEKSNGIFHQQKDIKVKQRKVRVNLQIELFGERYRLVVDRNAKSQSQKHCDKCALRGRGVCYWDNEKGIDDEKSITANLFCQDTSEYGRWFGYWSRMNGA